MKLKKYEHPTAEIDIFCKDAILNSDLSTKADDWYDYEDRNELF